MASRMTGLERRNIILDEAGRLFAFKGLHGTTTKDIAKAAGISEPVLYQHFKNKEEIYQTLEMICSQQTAYFHSVIKDLGPGLDCFITITYLLVRVISFNKEPGTKLNPKEAAPAEILMRLMGYSFLENGRFALSLVDNCIGSFFDQWHESYKKIHEQGHVTVAKPDSVHLWMAYEAIIGMGMFVLPNLLLLKKVPDTQSGSKNATLFLLRAVGMKESVIEKNVNWTSLQKFYARLEKPE